MLKLAEMAFQGPEEFVVTIKVAGPGMTVVVRYDAPIAETLATLRVFSNKPAFQSIEGIVVRMDVAPCDLHHVKRCLVMYQKGLRIRCVLDDTRDDYNSSHYKVKCCTTTVQMSSKEVTQIAQGVVFEDHEEPGTDHLVHAIGVKPSGRRTCENCRKLMLPWGQAIELPFRR